MWHSNSKVGVAAVACTSMLLLGSAVPGSARSPQWWRAAAVQRELRLTTEQIATIDRIFRTDLQERRELARNQEALEARLAAALLEGTLDDQAVSQLVEKVVQVQARRNVSRTLMLLRMYRVLTTEQRVRFKHTLQAGN